MVVCRHVCVCVRATLHHTRLDVRSLQQIHMADWAFARLVATSSKSVRLKLYNTKQVCEDSTTATPTPRVATKISVKSIIFMYVIL